MKKLKFTYLARGVAIAALLLGGIVMVIGVYALFSGIRSPGQAYMAALMLGSGVSILCFAALIGAISEISLNIALGGGQPK